MSLHRTQFGLGAPLTHTARFFGAEVPDSAGNRGRKCIGAYHFHVSTSVVFLSVFVRLGVRICPGQGSILSVGVPVKSLIQAVVSQIVERGG
jgi:hypothetical protein